MGPLPIDHALPGKTREKVGAENLIERSDRFGRNQDANVISRSVNQVGPLTCDGRNDVEVAQLLIFLVERLDNAIGMSRVVLLNELIKEIALSTYLLVPDANVHPGIRRPFATGRR